MSRNDDLHVNDPDGEGLDEDSGIDEDDLVLLEDEEGVVQQFVRLAHVEVDEQDYVVLAPIEQISDEGEGDLELYIFRYEDRGDGSGAYEGIEDDEEFERVREYCSTLFVVEGSEE